MPSASSKKRKERGRNNERNRQRKVQGAEVKDLRTEEDEVLEMETQKELNRDTKDVAKEIALKELEATKLADFTAIEKLRAEQAEENAAARNATGTLTSKELSTSIHIHALSVTYHGVVLIDDTNLALDNHHRYGIIGPNGCGKSTLMATIGNRDVPIPSNLDIFYLDHEMAPSEKTPIKAVMDVDVERKRLEKEADHLQEIDPESEYLIDLYARLDELDVEKAEATASRILKGLGFTNEMQHKKLSDFSGGWRMRVSLARALFVKPYLLLLDEPTNHLDLEACVWLEEELKSFQHILMIVSHSQDFLNGVCTNMINIKDKKLEYYTGNYDQYIKTKSEIEENQMKRYQWEQEQIANMKNYIARFGHGSAKLAKQAQSKEKTLARMIEKGLTEKVTMERSISFAFKDIDRLPPPVIQVQDISFRYTDTGPWIYKNVEFGLDQDTRIALVGPNGAGKSTLLKLLIGDLEPTDGMIRRHNHVKMGHYHQHLAEQLDMNASPLQYMMKEFPQLKDIDGVRKIIGRYGISGKQQTMPIRNLSEGQKCRVSLAWLAWQSPHMLMLDEPTNHLDLESIDALANAIKTFNGGMILVSHDFRLIGQVADEIWICERQKVTKWSKSIQDYKEVLKNNVLGVDGKRKNMAAASADHYHKDDTDPNSMAGKLKSQTVVKKMQILGLSSNKSLMNGNLNGNSKNSSANSSRSSSTSKKFLPPGKLVNGKSSSVGKQVNGALQNGHGSNSDWWGD